MRLRLILRCVSKPLVIPINYNYQFSSAIHKLFKLNSPDFSKFLNENYDKLENKNFDLFTFAIKLRKYEVNPVTNFSGNHFRLLSPYVELLISSPIIGSYINNSFIERFKDEKIYITYTEYITKFIIERVEFIYEPQFTSEMSFRLLNPLVLYKIIQSNGHWMVYYLRIDDHGLENILLKNLKQKYELLYGKKINTSNLTLKFDEDYIKRKNGNVSKLITIGEGTKNEMKIKGILCDFTINANPELIRIGYECGFGTKTSLGFGFAEVKNNKFSQPINLHHTN